MFASPSFLISLTLLCAHFTVFPFLRKCSLCLHMMDHTFAFVLQFNCRYLGLIGSGCRTLLRCDCFQLAGSSDFLISYAFSFKVIQKFRLSAWSPSQLSTAWWSGHQTWPSGHLLLLPQQLFLLLLLQQLFLFLLLLQLSLIHIPHLAWKGQHLKCFFFIHWTWDQHLVLL